MASAVMEVSPRLVIRAGVWDTGKGCQMVKQVGDRRCDGGPHQLSVGQSPAAQRACAV